MIYNIEESMRRQVTFVARTYMPDHMLYESISRRSLKLLYEANDNAIKPEEIKDDIVRIKKMMLKVMGMLPSDVAPDLVKQLKVLTDKIPDPSKVETELFAGDEKKMQFIAKEVTTSIGNAIRAVATIANGLQLVSKAFQPFLEEIGDDAKTKTIGELLDDEKLKGKFMPKDKFEAGIKKAFVPSKDVESALQKGIKAAQKDVGAAGGKSDTGKMFASIGRFFTGLFSKKSSVESFPKLFTAFKEFIQKSKIEDIQKLSEELKTANSQLIVGATAAAETSSTVGAASQGAPVAGQEGGEGKEGGAGGKKVKADELEKAIAGKHPGAAKILIAALKKDEKTKDMLEGRLFRENGMPTFRFILSETVTYDDILKIVKSADPAFTKKPEKAEQYAAKIAKFMKSKGADVDDKGAPEIKEDAEEEAPDDAKGAEAAAEKAAADAKAAASKTTMGKAIHKALIDYLQPYVDRKSLSGKAREALTASVEKDLNTNLDKISADLADLSAGELKGVLEKWFNKLDPNLQKKLGGPVGSKKMLQAAAKNIEDIVKANFKVEENKKKNDDLIVERWQKLAGIL